MTMTSTRTRSWLPLYALAVAWGLAACGPGDGTPARGEPPAAPKAERAEPSAPPPRPVARGELGTITAIVPVHSREPVSGAGAVIGGVVGGALGNQVGKGDGRTAATVIGVLGGAAVGNKIEKDRRTHITGYRVDVRLDGGRVDSFTTPNAGDYANGQRVRVVDGALQRV